LRVTERIRDRWRRSRHELGLANPDEEGFGAAGLARFVEDRAARLVILPSDPESSDISFTGDFWSWWEEKRPDPADGGSPTQWGSRVRSCSFAALRIDERSTSEWRRYVALLRSGGLDVTLGSDAGFNLEEPQRRFFRLSIIVGRVWAALSLYRAVLDRYELPGPWQIGLALLRTEGAILSGFGRDWREPNGVFGAIGHCYERNLWISRELGAWPDEKGVKELAFEVGGRIEDAWGVRERRFLHLRGERTGEFDANNYGWH
jgi:hypothetical protein